MVLEGGWDWGRSWGRVVMDWGSLGQGWGSQGGLGLGKGLGTTVCCVGGVVAGVGFGGRHWWGWDRDGFGPLQYFGGWGRIGVPDVGGVGLMGRGPRGCLWGSLGI